MKQEEINTKIGCYSHLSDFGWGGLWGLPGFHWNKNYVCQIIKLTPPLAKSSIVFYNCPTCNRKIKIKIPSIKRGKRDRIINRAIGLSTLIFIILLITFNFSNFSLDHDQIEVIKIQGTIIGLLVAVYFISKSFSKWACYYPKICKDIHFIFIKHKFFHT
jgi:hypothetical protein